MFVIIKPAWFKENNSPRVNSIHVFFVEKRKFSISYIPLYFNVTLLTLLSKIIKLPG